MLGRIIILATLRHRTRTYPCRTSPVGSLHDHAHLLSRVALGEDDQREEAIRDAGIFGERAEGGDEGAHTRCAEWNWILGTDELQQPVTADPNREAISGSQHSRSNWKATSGSLHS